MKCTLPEISWHNRDPVLSIDIQQVSDASFYRVATGGTDHHVVIWQLNILDNGGVSVEMLSDLTHHNRAVNAVRFSPNSQFLASSDDEAAIILWKKSNTYNDLFENDKEMENKEHWTIFKLLRSHIEDVYDLCWSSCSQFLVSGSVDNTAILWDVQKGKNLCILNDHKGFVQGVAWDPKGQYIATMSSDRCFRIFNFATKKVVHRVSKSSIFPSNEKGQKTTRLFYDDTLKSYYRRLAFSPDGKLVIVPAGIVENGNGVKPVNGSYVFLRTSLNRPSLFLPTNEKYTIAIRFCPKLFELRKSENENKDPNYTNLFNLPYRMVFAIATQNAVLIYDTQQPVPFAKVSNIHYTRLSDATWSSDGRILMVSSTDGYCSLISFNEDEIGVPYSESQTMEISDQDSKSIKSGSESSKNKEIVKVSVSKTSEIEITPPSSQNSLLTSQSSKNEISNCEEKMEIESLEENVKKNLKSVNILKPKNENVEIIFLDGSPKKTKKVCKDTLENLNYSSETLESGIENSKNVEISETRKEDSKNLEISEAGKENSKNFKKLEAGKENSKNSEKSEAEKENSKNSKKSEAEKENSKSLEKSVAEKENPKNPKAAPYLPASLIKRKPGKRVELITLSAPAKSPGKVQEMVKETVKLSPQKMQIENIEDKSNRDTKRKEETVEIENKIKEGTVNDQTENNDIDKNISKCIPDVALSETSVKKPRLDDAQSAQNINRDKKVSESSEATTEKEAASETSPEITTEKGEELGAKSNASTANNTADTAEKVPPLPKTPRRVQLITISSPKCKN